MKTQLRILLGFCVLLFSLSAQAFFTQKSDFLPVEQAFSISLNQQPEKSSLQWRIAPGYYLYQHSIKAYQAGEQQLQLQLPAGQENEDEFFGLTEIYYQSLEIELPQQVEYPLEVTWQGCADAGLCYPPQTTLLQPASAQKDNAVPTGAGQLAQDQSIAQRLAASGLLLNLSAFFVMGLLLAFTPCMLPMLPILSSVIAGSKPGGWQGARLGTVFVLAMSLVYALLGVLAARLGSNLSAALQNPWLLVPFAGLFVLLALAQFGLYSLQLPGFIRNRLHSTDQKIQGGSLLGAGALGVLSALLVGPCMTAPLAGALLYIGQDGDAVKGALVLFALGIGSGLPLLVAMSFGMRWLPKPGQWMQAVNRIFAYALLAAAIFILRALLPDSLTLALWAALLMAISLHLGRWRPAGYRLLVRYCAALLFVWSAIMLLGAASGGNDPLQPLRHWQAGPEASGNQQVQARRMADPHELKQQMAAARANDQWVILDFYADWCVSCKVMERTVFAQPEVQQAIADISFLQPDVTANSKAQQALLREYSIIGPPTIIFINPQGEEVRSARITGEVNAGEFLQYLQQARGS